MGAGCERGVAYRSHGGAALTSGSPVCCTYQSACEEGAAKGNIGALGFGSPWQRLSRNERPWRADARGVGSVGCAPAPQPPVGTASAATLRGRDGLVRCRPRRELHARERMGCGLLTHLRVYQQRDGDMRQEPHGAQHIEGGHGASRLCCHRMLLLSPVPHCLQHANTRNLVCTTFLATPPALRCWR